MLFPRPNPTSRIFYGWWIVHAYFLINFYWDGTLLLGLSALFNPIRDALGLTATVTTVAISMRQGVAVVGSPMVGYVFDQIGPRALMLIATISTAGGMTLLAFADSTWAFFLAFAISSFGFVIFVAGTGPSAVALWFVRRRGLAMGIIIAGAGVGAFLVPAIVWLEGEWGWRVAIIVIVIGLMAIGIPTSLLLRHRPEDYGLRPDGDLPGVKAHAERSSSTHPPDAMRPGQDFGFGETMRSQAFWLLAASYGIGALGFSSAMLFIIPHLEETGFSRTTGGVTVAVMGIIALIGTVGLGWLSDYVEQRYLIMLAYLFQGGGLVVLAYASSTWHLVPFAVLFGIGSQSSIPIISSLQARYFGQAHYGKIQGMLTSTFAIGSTGGPILGAAVRDITGTYTPIFVAYAAATGIAILAMAMVRPPRRLGAPYAAGSN